MDRSKVSDTTNINWPLYHVALRIAIAHILKNDRLRNVRCTAAQLIPILHSLAGVQEGIYDREKVTVDIIKTAFSRMSEHYTVPYSKIGIEGTTNESLIVRNGCRSVLCTPCLLVSLVNGIFTDRLETDYCYIIPLPLVE